MISKPQHARAVLDAISLKQDGKAASATTIARKRSVFANVIRYAVELEEMPSSPLDRLSWTPLKVSEVVDRRVVVNPRQARELLTAVTYVGQQRRGPHARGQRLMAFASCPPRVRACRAAQVSAGGSRAPIHESPAESRRVPSCRRTSAARIAPGPAGRPPSCPEVGAPKGSFRPSAATGAARQPSRGGPRQTVCRAGTSPGAGSRRGASEPRRRPAR
jgi:hypothetical protein